jgi:hypothetical protein
MKRFSPLKLSAVRRAGRSGLPLGQTATGFERPAGPGMPILRVMWVYQKLDFKPRVRPMVGSLLWVAKFTPPVSKVFAETL